ncbi:MAG TPA: hypothetical protein VEH83_06255 [Gemmatimonadales bacterium]|nr:hypothetical protein [Gemmatimonadales bacterium]
MGATPVLGKSGESRPASRARPRETATTRSPESCVWGYVVHPSLLPTIFSPSGDDPGGQSEERPTARKV